MKKLITVIMVLAVATIAYAGTIRQFTCSNKECNFKAEVFSGRGKASTIVAGFCKQCEKMVTVKVRNRNLKGGKITPLTQVWDSTTGKILDLYECPYCKRPFARITRMIYCPKCGKKSISESMTGKWD